MPRSAPELATSITSWRTMARVSSLRNGRRDPSLKVSRPNVSGHRLSTAEVGRAIRRPREHCRGDGDRDGQAFCTSVTLAEANQLPKTRCGRSCAASATSPRGGRWDDLMTLRDPGVLEEVENRSPPRRMPECVRYRCCRAGTQRDRLAKHRVFRTPRDETVQFASILCDKFDTP